MINIINYINKCFNFLIKNKQRIYFNSHFCRHSFYMKIIEQKLRLTMILIPNT